MNNVIEMLKDVDGQVSSKRVMSLVILALFSYMAIGSCYGLIIKDNIWDDVFYALMAFAGMITSEKFTKRSVRNDASPTPTQTTTA